MQTSRVLHIALDKREVVCRLMRTFVVGKANRGNSSNSKNNSSSSSSSKNNVVDISKMFPILKDVICNAKQSRRNFSTDISQEANEQQQQQHTKQEKPTQQLVVNNNSDKHIYGADANDDVDNEEYASAIRDLNTLQPNAETIRASIAYNNKCISLDATRTVVLRSGLLLNDLDKLSVIHVSGTKGKGSTCALTEAILRAHGYKTGFFSSPHLVSATERIRINGQPIDKRQFTRAFRRVYQRLQATQTHENDMPAFFTFLTILCFHIFLEQKVDVAILEVGIGGEYDCTNVVRNTKTVGITTLALEHTNLLGDKITDIAYHKAGIIKPHANVYTSVTQPECLAVIRKRALEQNATVHLVSNLSEYLQTAAEASLYKQLNVITQLNGALAIALAFDWLRHNSNNAKQQDYKKLPESVILTPNIWNSLLNCTWPGRCQQLKFQNFNMYLDGAHTVESMQVCSSWFKLNNQTSKNVKILIFNTTGQRDSKKLLEVLYHSIYFDLALFVPNITSGSANKQDNQSAIYPLSDQIKRAKLNASNWHFLCAQADQTDNYEIFTSILDCFSSLRQKFGNQKQLDVLVTGSLHLIGATILALKEFQQQIKDTALVEK